MKGGHTVAESHKAARTTPWQDFSAGVLASLASLPARVRGLSNTSGVGTKAANLPGD